MTGPICLGSRGALSPELSRLAPEVTTQHPKMDL